jgi:hypothetical protein
VRLIEELITRKRVHGGEASMTKQSSSFIELPNGKAIDLKESIEATFFWETCLELCLFI